MGHRINIPLMRPKLPEAAEILGYLQQIDASRWYTNSGPLLRRFESRLARHFAGPEGCAVCITNGTLGLVLTLKALGVPSGGFCAMPSWTFMATPAAAVAAGLAPWFLDIEERTWALDPAMVEEHLARAPGPVRAVIPVSPFGAPLDLAAWAEFRERTNIPVIVDMAAGFDSCAADMVPVVVSLHATKVFGVGEGGLVVTNDQDLAASIRRRANYGVKPGAGATSEGINAKMSEYAAAVGLAGLDRWPRQREIYSALTRTYREKLGTMAGVSFVPSFGEDWLSSTCNVRFDWGQADRLIAALRLKGIECRQWWGKGCHRQPAFSRYPTTPLPVTEALSATVLGLPFYPGLSESEIDRIRDSLDGIYRAQGAR